MSIDEQLAEIMRKMEAQTRNADNEIAHGVGDDLLIDTINLLAGECSPERRDTISRIVLNWGRIPKWYA